MTRSDEEKRRIERDFNALIKTVLTNESKDFFRSYYRQSHHMLPTDQNGFFAFKSEMSVMPSITDQDIPHIEVFIGDDALATAVGTLTEREKLILYTKIFQDLTDRQAAVQLGISQQAFSKSKKQILNKLQDLLEKMVPSFPA